MHVGLLAQRCHRREQLHVASQLAEALDEMASQQPIVHLRAIRVARGGDDLAAGPRPAVTQQPRPLLDRVVVFRILGRRKGRQLRELLDAPLEPLALLLAMDEKNVRRGLDEGRVWQDALLHEEGPEGKRRHEFVVRRDGLVDLHRLAILGVWCVVWLAQRRVTRPSVVPLVRRLQSYSVMLLNELNLPVGLQ